MHTTVLVTGGAGFIGSHLVDALLSRGHKVIAFDNLRNGTKSNLEAAFRNPNFQFIQGDILKPEELTSALEGVQYVYHLACLGVRHSIYNPYENHCVNAEGTLNVLEAARNSKVKQFFYISSSEIYGKATEFPLSEGALPRPLTVYGASKLVGEHYTHAYLDCYKLKTVVLRIFNNYGPRAHYKGDSGEVIPRSIIRIMENQKPIIFGSGSHTRDFIYVEDTARVLADLLFNDQIIGDTFNIGTGEELTIKALLEEVLKVMGKESLGMEYMEERVADVPRLWVNVDKFRRLTGFKTQYSLKEGLSKTIGYYQQLASKQDLLSAIKIRNWEG